MAPRPQRKSKSVDALKRCDNDPRIIASIANLFWLDRKVVGPSWMLGGRRL
jgi:pre-mRNA-processing factor 6